MSIYHLKNYIEDLDDNTYITVKEVKNLLTKTNYTKGEKHPSAKLTEDKVREIKRRIIKQGVAIRELSEEYDVTYTSIWNISKGVTWRHV